MVVLAQAALPQEGPTWEMLSLIVAAVLFGGSALWYAGKAFASTRDFDKLVARVDTMEERQVTRDLFDSEMKRIYEELAHRKKSMETMGNALTAMSKTIHRMDKVVFAIATKLEVQEPPNDDGD